MGSNFFMARSAVWRPRAGRAGLVRKQEGTPSQQAPICTHSSETGPKETVGLERLHQLAVGTAATGWQRASPASPPPLHPPTFELLILVQLAGEAKVRQLNVHVVVQEDVLRLQVPVDDVDGVEVLDHFQQCTHDLPGDG